MRVTSLALSIAALAALALGLSGCGKEEPKDTLPTAPAAPSAPAAAPENSAFTEALPASLNGLTGEPGGKCFLDSIDRVLATENNPVERGGTVLFSGWAVDDKLGTVPLELTLRLTSADGAHTYYASTSVRSQRPDVAQVLNNPAYEPSGFELAASLDNLPAGDYWVSLLQASGASVLACETQRKVSLQ
jgi:hypothetical protein